MNQFPHSFLILIWLVSCRTSSSSDIFHVSTHFKPIIPLQDTQPFHNNISLCCYLQFHLHLLPNFAQDLMLMHCSNHLTFLDQNKNVHLYKHCCCLIGFTNIQDTTRHVTTHHCLVTSPTHKTQPDTSQHTTA